MVEHNLKVVADLSRPHHRARARRRCWRKATTDRLERIRGCSKPISGPAMPEPAARPAPLLAVDELNAWYGESHVLHGVDFDVQRRRGGHAARPQRRRPDHHAARRSWASSASARARSSVDGAERSACRRTNRPAGRRLLPRRARHLRQPLGRGEPDAAAARSPPAGLRSSEIYEMFPNLKERLHSPGTQLSGGEQQMLAIGRILRTGARLLLLDEISEGLAPVIVQKLGRMIAQLKARASPSCWWSRTSASPRRGRPLLCDGARPHRRRFAKRELEAQHGQAARVPRRLTPRLHRSNGWRTS